MAIKCFEFSGYIEPIANNRTATGEVFFQGIKIEIFARIKINIIKYLVY